MRAELVKFQKDYLIEMEDVVVVTRDEDGRVRLHQPTSPAAAGAVGGGLWGALIGLIFLNPLLGAAIGAGTGALASSFTDPGMRDSKMRAANRDRAAAPLAPPSAEPRGMDAKDP